MSSIQCPECKKDISDTAKTCPNCGHPLKNRKPAIIVLAIICAIIAVYVLISGLNDFFHAAAITSATQDEPNNLLSEKYYMWTIDTKVYVLKFCDGNILEIVNCGWGRSVDTRKKEYGTYEIDENIVTIVLDGKDSYKCPVVNDGDTFSIVDPSTLSSETLEAFD